MSEQDDKKDTPVEATETSPGRADGLRGWLLVAGDWLQGPPGKHMGLQTTLVVLLIMVLLVWVGSWFS